MPAWVLMWTLAFALYASMKVITWWKARGRVPHTAWRSLAYLTTWPGMDAPTFLDASQVASKPLVGDWFRALGKMTLGVVLFWVVARRVPTQPLVQGWIGLFRLVSIFHFGSFYLIALFWQSQGIRARPIMAKPALSHTLSEFWGKRWNLAFRQLGYELIFQPLHKKVGAPLAGFMVFLVSGVVHDLVLSLPARGGYGLPTGYFVVQGLGTALERSPLGRQLGLQQGFPGRLFAFVVVAGPAFWLFHPPFLMRVILPFMHAVGAL